LDDVFREHSRLIYRAAYSVTACREDAEDVVQALFLQLWRRGLPSGFGKNPRGYLYRAAINLALNVVRARRRQPLPVAPVGPQPRTYLPPIRRRGVAPDLNAIAPYVPVPAQRGPRTPSAPRFPRQIVPRPQEPVTQPTGYPFPPPQTAMEIPQKLWGFATPGDASAMWPYLPQMMPLPSYLGLQSGIQNWQVLPPLSGANAPSWAQYQANL